MGFELYEDFCITLEQISTQIDRRISGDTLFGKFSWTFVEIYGEENFAELLKEHCSSPVAVFSGIFPEGCVPMPVFLPFLGEFSAQSESEYEGLKSLKKVQYIELQGINELFSGLRLDLEGPFQRGFSKSGQRIHVAISRLDGTALKGMIYSTSEVRFDSKLWLFLRVSQEFCRKFDIEKILKVMFDTGLGARKSSGKGHFRVKEIAATSDLRPVGGENAFLSLSRWVPKPEDPTTGYYRIFSKRPKIGGIFSEMGIFQKKPLLMIEEGSWFYTENIEPCFGTVVEKVQLPIYGLDSNLVQSCYCLPLYFKAPLKGD